MSVYHMHKISSLTQWIASFKTIIMISLQNWPLTFISYYQLKLLLFTYILYSAI
uniref:Uncharacterized protein n=1 Tax=Manihot esculenta TaxID=3983 RepID=A0A2C9VQB0_MANES